MSQSFTPARRAIRTTVTGAAVTALIALALVDPAQSATASTLIPYTVDFTVADVTNGYTTWTVPTGVTSLRITAIGANGGTAATDFPGGFGAVVQVDLAVTAAQVLTVAVGSVGGSGFGGVPGGGIGYTGRGGGGFSGVILADLTPIVVAGAGGGSGVPAGRGGNAGAAGGDDGGFGGQPGTIAAGGAGGAGAPFGHGEAGSSYQGGNAGGGWSGGGGAGYFGGGGGGSNYSGGGGGGGSSYPASGHPSIVFTALKTIAEPAEGRVTLEFDRFAFEVVFDSADGVSAPTLDDVHIGNAATAPADPTRVGYNFDGWHTHPTAGMRWDFSNVVTVDVTLFARWVALPAPASPDGLANTGASILPQIAGGLGLAGLGGLLVLVGRTRRRASTPS